MYTGYEWHLSDAFLKPLTFSGECTINISLSYSLVKIDELNSIESICKNQEQRKQ